MFGFDCGEYEVKKMLAGLIKKLESDRKEN